MLAITGSDGSTYIAEVRFDSFSGVREDVSIRIGDDNGVATGRKHLGDAVPINPAPSTVMFNGCCIAHSDVSNRFEMHSHLWLLFVAQGEHGLDAGGFARGDAGGEQAAKPENYGNPAKVSGSLGRTPRAWP